MRGEQRAAADVVVQVFADRPGQRDAVERARPAADLIENHQAARGRVVKDVRRFGHLDHERALAATQLVRRPDAREQAVHNADSRSLRRHETADLGQHREQGNLANVRAFSGHIWAGDQHNRAVRAAELGVIRDEFAGRLQGVEDRVPAGFDLQHRLGDDLRAAVSLPHGEFGERGEDVDLRQHRTGLNQAAAPPPPRDPAT